MIALRMKRKGVIAILGTMMAATALIGWMHTPGARHILRTLGVPCPVDNVTSVQVSNLREKGMAGMRGQTIAPARPAAGMMLDQTTEADVSTWARTNAANCESVVHGYRFLRCRGVAAKTLGIDGPAISELWFSFGPAGKLVGVDVYRRGLDEQGTAVAWTSATDKLKSALGDPEVHFGDPSPAKLLASTLQTARVQYRYADYVATVTAVNLPQGGLAVREQYLSGNRQL